MAKPAFDPSKPFEAAKPAFDPSKPFGAADAPETDDEARADALAQGSTILHQGLQGMTRGFSDELGGLGTAGIQAATNALPDSWRDKLGLVKADPSEAYQYSRDQERQLLAKQMKENPGLSIASQIGGGLALPTPGIPLPAGAGLGLKLAAGVGGGGLEGGLVGLGMSNADNAYDAVGGTLKGMGIGAGAGAAGTLLSAGAQKVGEYAGGRVQAGLAKAQELAEQKQADLENAARGALGGEVQKGNRMVENLMRLMPDMTPEQQQALQKLDASGALDELKHRLADANLRDLPGQVGAINQKAQDFADLVGNRGPNVAQEAQRIASPAEALQQVGARVKRYGPVWAGGIAKAALGDEAGPGALAGAGLRPSINAIRRMMGHPSVQIPAWKAVQYAVGKAPQAALEAIGPARTAVLANALHEGGEEGFAVHHFIMSQSDPGYSEALAKVDEGQ